jgi:hypothetical protein
MPGLKRPPSDLPIRAFSSSKDWHRWLEAEHASAAGLWLKIARKDSGLPSVTYAAALEVALSTDGSTGSGAASTRNISFSDSALEGGKASGRRSTVHPPSG